MQYELLIGCDLQGQSRSLWGQNWSDDGICNLCLIVFVSRTASSRQTVVIPCFVYLHSNRATTSSLNTLRLVGLHYYFLMETCSNYRSSIIDEIYPVRHFQAQRVVFAGALDPNPTAVSPSRGHPYPSLPHQSPPTCVSLWRPYCSQRLASICNYQHAPTELSAL